MGSASVAELQHAGTCSFCGLKLDVLGTDGMVKGLNGHTVVLSWRCKCICKHFRSCLLDKMASGVEDGQCDVHLHDYMEGLHGVSVYPDRLVHEYLLMIQKPRRMNMHLKRMSLMKQHLKMEVEDEVALDAPIYWKWQSGGEQHAILRGFGAMIRRGDDAAGYPKGR